MEDLTYLDPGFDAKKLKVAELRDILQRHDVSVSSTAKKQQLLDAFATDITPRSAELRRQLEGERPSSTKTAQTKTKGRAHDRRQATTVSEDQDMDADDEKPTRPDTTASKAKASHGRGGRGRRAAVRQDSVFSSDEEASSQETAVQSSKSQQISDDDEDTSKSKATNKRKIGRPRKSASVLVNSIVSPDPTLSGADHDIGPAVSHSANKAAIAAATAKALSKKQKERNQSRATKEVKEEPTSSLLMSEEEDHTVVVSERVRHGRGRSRKAADSNNDDTLQNDKEEDIPESTTHRRGKDRDSKSNHLPTFKQKGTPEISKRGSRRGIGATKTYLGVDRQIWAPILDLPWVSLVTAIGLILLVANLAWYRHLKFRQGYCDTGELPPNKGEGSDIFFLQNPTCLPCPAHATCSSKRVDKCDSDYTLVEPSLGTFWPRSASCDPTTEDGRQIQSVANAALDILNRKAGSVECSSGENETGLYEKDLAHAVFEQREKGISDDQFRKVWQEAVTDLHTRRTELSIEPTGEGRLFRSLRPKYPLICQTQRTLAHIIFGYAKTTIAVLLIVGALVYTRIRYNQDWNYTGVSINAN